MKTFQENPSSRALTDRRITHAILISLLIILSLIWIYPIVWAAITSLRPELEITRNPNTIIPESMSFEHWDAMLNSRMPRWLMNSLIVTITHTLLQLFICSLAAYGFARLKFRGKNFLFVLVLCGLMVPSNATFIPVYLLFSNLKLHNTYIALILPGVASSFALFLLTQFFKGIPTEIEEAAVIDGATRWGIYRRIILPLSLPVLTTLGIFTFIGNWNDYLWPKISATQPDIMTLTVGLNTVAQTVRFENPVGRTMAALWLGTMPILLVYVLFQRRIVQGIQLTSGLK